MPKFIVTAREITIRKYEVQARNADVAREMANEFGTMSMDFVEEVTCYEEIDDVSVAESFTGPCHLEQTGYIE